MDTRGSWDISTSLKRQAFKLRDECDFEGMSANAILMTSSDMDRTAGVFLATVPAIARR